jgi:hypothetical protein
MFFKPTSAKLEGLLNKLISVAGLLNIYTQQNNNQNYSKKVASGIKISETFTEGDGSVQLTS